MLGAQGTGSPGVSYNTATVAKSSASTIDNGNDDSGSSLDGIRMAKELYMKPLNEVPMPPGGVMPTYTGLGEF